VTEEAIRLTALLAQTTSTLVALGALYVTFRNEQRNQYRFEQQLDFSRRIAEANIRPLLALTTSAYLDRKALELVNHGAGTAVVTNIVFRRGDQSAASIQDVLQLSQNVIWNDFTELDDVVEYLPPRTTDVLVELTLDHVIAQGIPERQAIKLMEELEQQLDETKVIVTYEDILGNLIAEDEQLN